MVRASTDSKKLGAEEASKKPLPNRECPHRGSETGRPELSLQPKQTKEMRLRELGPLSPAGVRSGREWCSISKRRGDKRAIPHESALSRLSSGPGRGR